MSRAAISVLALCIIAVPFTRGDAPTIRRTLSVDRFFDQYGRIKWEDEQARLDNFAIQIMNDPETIGYIFVYDGNNLCEGEAQARAMRAKRYLVEYRGLPSNRVIWRIEGHIKEALTTLQPVSRSVPISYPFMQVIMRSPRSHVTRHCRAGIAEIRKSKIGKQS
jgi:hypothetical protein